MTSVTLNGNTYSADGSAAKDMQGGGHRTHFIPCLADMMVEAGAAAQASADAVSSGAAAMLAAESAAISANAAAVYAASVAVAYAATTAASLSVGAGSKSFVTQTGKLFRAGHYVTISRVSDPSVFMYGSVTSYDASTGDMVVNATALNGAGTHTDWDINLASTFVKLPIFSDAAATLRPVANGENLTANNAALPPVGIRAIYSHSLFIAYGVSAPSVATSTDGLTWVVRTMPATAIWQLASDGNNLLATANTSTNCATSADGLAWNAATELPVNGGKPTGINGVWLAGVSATTVHRSTDLGATWTPQTLPATTGTSIFKVGAYFWYWSSGTTAYYSDTGLTESWTSMALPVTPVNATVYEVADGVVRFSANAANAKVYELTNPVAGAVELPGVLTPADSTMVFKIGNTNVTFNSTYGNCRTWGNYGSTVRNSDLTANNTFGNCNNGSVYLIGNYTMLRFSVADGPYSIYEV